MTELKESKSRYIWLKSYLFIDFFIFIYMFVYLGGFENVLGLSQTNGHMLLSEL